MTDEKKIGILTSGGDAPGMNAVIRAVVRSGRAVGLRVIGIRSGYAGLIAGEAFELRDRDVAGIDRLGGTVLHTARCPEMYSDAGLRQAVERARALGLDGLVAVGGDGTFRGAEKLSRLGIPTVGIPATIDNDIPCTDYTIGFDTACNVALEAVDRLRDTSESHFRCSVVEVMGHTSGSLALNVAVACGAAAVLIPERPADLEKEVLSVIRENRRHHSIVVVAEGCSVRAADLAERILAETGVETRLTVLGHIQRGGTPTSMDRSFAALAGCRAVELLKSGAGDRVVCRRGGTVVDEDIRSALAREPVFDEALYDAFRAIRR